MIKWWNTPQDMLDCLDPVQVRFLNNQFNLDIQSQKGKQMNEIVNGMVEVLDEHGNPTGQWIKAGEGETSPTETTFIAADAADHVI